MPALQPIRTTRIAISLNIRMAYIIFTVRGRELGRRQLTGPLVIGRSPECDVCVHDILLSRQHCSFEPVADGWAVLDLQSKNGTFIGTREIGRHVLTDGESVRIGKTMLTFCAAKFAPAPREKPPVVEMKPETRKKRPADPWAAMNDTMSGVEYVKSQVEKVNQRIGAKIPMADRIPAPSLSSMPTPQPAPREPQAYEKEDIYSLLTELASSSWDSIYMTNSRPLPARPAPRPIVVGSRHSRYRGAPAVDMSLQVTPGLLAQPTPGKPKRSRWHRAFRSVARGFATIGQTVMVLGIVHLLAHI